MEPRPPVMEVPPMMAPASFVKLKACAVPGAIDEENTAA